MAFRQNWREREPGWHNAPVEGYGSLKARLLVLGLAPGLKGANMSGLPFSGDGSGDYLYRFLIKYGFAEGNYENHDAATVLMTDSRVSNAVRCVPPENRPTGAEANACMPFLEAEIAAMSNLQAVLNLGKLAHQRALKVFGEKQSSMKFAHRARKTLENGVTLFDSYHCSRYNLNTGRLTVKMFEAVFSDIRDFLD
ncbi:uracil-DNA glycosylase [Aestuariispira insulae]|uniref:uracil-DNA glycosylase n=1 Tax=Aestuariispira insulae TaxID=1461337 RepID=UPI001FE9042C|nr:uracil-DNA glycosylase [Aestuariispira insulae]